MATTYIPPTVKQFVDGAMVAFFDASATSAIEAAFESSTQAPLSAVSNQTIVNLGLAFATAPSITGNFTADIQNIAINLTGSPITVTGELPVFQQQYQALVGAVIPGLNGVTRLPSPRPRASWSPNSWRPLSVLRAPISA